MNIKDIEGQIVAKEQEARALLHQLEHVLVACGYTRGSTYNSHIHGLDAYRKPPRGRATVICWWDRTLSFGVGEGKQPIPIDDMNTRQLLAVADHLAPFLDHLENNSRHVLEKLTEAERSLREFIDNIKRDSRPA